MSASPYGVGFRSLEQECSERELEPQGAIPDWLEGALLRTGPAKFEVGERTYNHWFDGLAMLHRFAFERGRVTYANRFLQSRAFTEAKRTGKICFGEFATDPCRTLFGRVAAIFRPPTLTDNGCVNVNPLDASTIAAFTETTLPVIFDPDTLETLGVFGYDRTISGQISTAHQHYDFARARAFNYAVQFGRKSLYRLFSVAHKDAAQELVAELPVARPAYMHSFGMSARYLVLTEFPLVVNPLMLRLSGRPFIRNYAWEPERGVTFRVFDKDGGKLVQSAQAEPFFAFHHVNAFEADGALHVDLITYDDASIIDQLCLERLRKSAPIEAVGKLTRARVPLSGDAAVALETLSDEPIELPRIDYSRRAGRPYRYVWGAGIATQGDFLDQIVKLDLETRKASHWREENCYPGEPIFVARPDAEAEDDGALLSVVLDARKDRSFLLVLDASTLQELARAGAPHAIPFGFHGNYFEGAQA